MFMTCRAPGAIRPAPAHADGGGKAAASEHPTDSLTKAITARASGPMTRRGTVSPCRTCLCGLCVCVEVCDPGGGRAGSTNFNDPRQKLDFQVETVCLLLCESLQLTGTSPGSFRPSTLVLSFAARSRVFYYDKMKLVTPPPEKKKVVTG